jgi:hypothetical protein
MPSVKRNPCLDLDCPKGSICVSADDSAAKCVANGTNPDTDPVDPSTEVDVCSGAPCPAGTECVAKQTTCIRAPCTPIAFCSKAQAPVDPKPVDPLPPTKATCTGKQCPEGTTCQLQTVACAKQPCNPVPICVPNCQRNDCPKIDPVCGSDGQTYLNLCALQNAVCKGRVGLSKTPAYSGACKQVCDADRPCGQDSVCSRDCTRRNLTRTMGAPDVMCSGVCLSKNLDPCSRMKCAMGYTCRVTQDNNGRMNASSQGKTVVTVCSPALVFTCVQNRSAEAARGGKPLTLCAVRTVLASCSKDVGCGSSLPAICNSMPADCLSDVCNGTVRGLPTRSEAALVDLLSSFTHVASNAPAPAKHSAAPVFLLTAVCVALGVALIVLGVSVRRLRAELAVTSYTQESLL